MIVWISFNITEYYGYQLSQIFLNLFYISIVKTIKLKS